MAKKTVENCGGLKLVSVTPKKPTKKPVKSGKK